MIGPKPRTTSLMNRLRGGMKAEDGTYVNKNFYGNQKPKQNKLKERIKAIRSRIK